jgi:nucleoside-diphosphate-sugar epimerase
MRRILIIGAVGQIGTDLTPALRARVGADNVVAAGRRTPPSPEMRDAGPFTQLDATDAEALRSVIEEYDVGAIYHLAALMSGDGEQDPQLAWRVNMESLKNVLDLAVELELEQVFWPSSIAVFGPTTPSRNTPQRTVLEPTTIYGVSKLAGEHLCHYYHLKYGLDVRSLRYPGLITYKTFSGGGTTDYAVEMFIEAIASGRYTCFVSPETRLPMMYMDDAVRATVELMFADASSLSVRTSYNVTALSFTAAELAAEVAKLVDGFSCDYEPDFRQAIADSWPDSIDDSAARSDWGWAPDFDLEVLVDVMLAGLRAARPDE